MLPVQFSTLILIFFVYIVILLSNTVSITLDIFIFKVNTTLSVIIFYSALFGGVFTLFIIQILKNMRNLKNKIRKYKSQTSSEKP